MCKHVAAVLYGIGARLDEQPALIFKLRGVDEAQLITSAAQGQALAAKRPASAKLLDDDLSALFGLEIEPPAAPQLAAKRSVPKVATKVATKTVGKTAGKMPVKAARKASVKAKGPAVPAKMLPPPKAKPATKVTAKVRERKTSAG